MKTTADLLAMKAELTNDPQGLGLDTNPAHDEANANKVNAVRAGDDGFVKTLTVKKRFLATNSIFGAVKALEAQSLTASQHQWFSDLLQLDHIDPFADSEAVEGLRGLFSTGTDSRTAIEAQFTEAGSRHSQMFQAGTLSTDEAWTPSEISNARQAV